MEVKDSSLSLSKCICSTLRFKFSPANRSLKRPIPLVADHEAHWVQLLITAIANLSRVLLDTPMATVLSCSWKLGTVPSITPNNAHGKSTKGIRRIEAFIAKKPDTKLDVNTMSDVNTMKQLQRERSLCSSSSWTLLGPDVTKWVRSFFYIANFSFLSHKMYRLLTSWHYRHNHTTKKLLQGQMSNYTPRSNLKDLCNII